MINIKCDGVWTYPDACKVVDNLKALGIEAGVTVGGVWIHFDLEKHGLAVVRIVKEARGAFCTQTYMQAIEIENAERVIRQRNIDALEAVWNS
jgi:hypothetical protein